MDSETFRKFLSGIAHIPDGEWRVARPFLKELRLKKGEHLSAAGEPATHFGWVLSGLMRKFYVDLKGRESARGFAAESQFVGAYASLLTGAPSRLTVEALEDSHLLAVRHGDFTALYPRHACWQELGRKVAEQLFLEREQREFELLTLSASERYRAFLQKHPSLAARLAQRDIASYLGITPVSLSRLRGKRTRGTPE